MLHRADITNDFITYIGTHFKSHTHLEITKRVLECISYIDNNLADIANHAGKVSLLRHPTNHMAFHLNGLTTPQGVIANFSKLISEVHACLNLLLGIKDPHIRYQVINIFLNHIIDSEVGCMDIRLRNAITFVGIYQSSGLLHINDLMLELLKGGNEITIERVLAFFNDKVDHHLLILNTENTAEPLTWSLIHKYMKDVFNFDFKAEWAEFIKKHPPIVSTIKRRQTWHYYYFDDQQSANLYLSYAKNTLPYFYQDELSKASVKRNGVGKYQFMLTDSQHKAFNRIISTYSHKNNPHDPDDLSKKIAAAFKDHGGLVKSIRWDYNCFIQKFSYSITKSEKNQPKENLRKGQHKLYTVTGAGVFKRSEKPTPYLPMSQEKIAKKKRKRSAFQSTSLITAHAQIPVFGHDQIRALKLVGVLIDPNDAMINRMMIYDSGTVSRPYESESYEEASLYYSEKVNPKEKEKKILFSSLEEFEKAITHQTQKHNEVLARFRWDIQSSAIGIFSDTFEARCIAQFYARVIRDRLKEQYKELDKPWDDSYQIPIIHYIPGSNKNWIPYTQAEQEKDRQYANKILQDENLLIKYFTENNFEFLLIADHPEINIFTLAINNMPILKYCLYHGELQLVESLCYLCNFHGQALVNYFQNNVPLQTLPIVDQEGNTALHLAAKSNHATLRLLLFNKDIDVNAKNKNGNTALFLAAINDHTEAAKLLLADSRLDVTIPDKNGNTVLFFAANNGNTELIKALLAHKHNNIINVVRPDGFTAFHYAIDSGHLPSLKLFLADPRLNLNVSTNSASTLLMFAAKKDNVEILSLLLKDPRLTRINAVDAMGMTALHIAIKNNKKEAAKLLLGDSRVNVNTADKNRETALMNVINKGDCELLALLLANKYLNINAVNGDGETALLIAMKKGREEMAKMLLADNRADVNVVGKHGDTVLMWAATNGDKEALQLLLNNPLLDNSNVNAVMVKHPALYFAIINRRVEATKILLMEPRVNMNVTKVLKWAKKTGDESFRLLVVKLLIKRYELQLSLREEEYTSTPTTLSSMGLFGYSREQKLKALQDLHIAEREHTAITDKTSLGALANGDLGKIIAELPSVTKKKLGL